MINVLCRETGIMPRVSILKEQQRWKNKADHQPNTKWILTLSVISFISTNNTTLNHIQATRDGKGRPIFSPQELILRTRIAQTRISQILTTSLPVLLSQTSIMKSNYESPWPHHWQFIIQLRLHRFYFLFLSVCHALVPQLFLQSQQASHLFLFTKKGQTDQFHRRNSRLSNLFDALSSYVRVSLHLTVH